MAIADDQCVIDTVYSEGQPTLGRDHRATITNHQKLGSLGFRWSSAASKTFSLRGAQPGPRGRQDRGLSDLTPPAKKVEMLFAHLKRILRLDRLRLRGPYGARDEFHLAAIAQNLRKLAKNVSGPRAIPAS
jgi:Transposase DDE domain